MTKSDSAYSKRQMAAGVSILAVCAGLMAASPSQSQTSAAPEAGSGNDVVIVTARRKALLTATERKKNADTVIDSIVADEAGKLPDASITEVLQRVSGVSIVRFSALGNPDGYSAEGSGVQVRGLSGVAARLNGREVFSANGGRGLSWGDVTPELMAAVDVYKASTSDLIEGGTGGQIDLRTKMPFDYKKPSVQASLSGSYGDMSKKTTPSYSVLATKRFDTNIGEIGALVDFAYSEYAARNNFIRMEPYYKTQVGSATRYIPGGYDYGANDFNRTRNGLYGAFQWRPSENLSFYTTLFESKYEEENTGSGLFVVSQNLTVDPTATNVFDDNGGLIKSTRLVTYNTSNGDTTTGGAINAGGNTGISRGTTETRDWTTGFSWNATERLRVTGSLQFVDSTNKRKNYDVFPGAAFPSSFSLDLSGDLPQITVPASAAAIFANPANYEWQAQMDHIESNHGTMQAAQLDADYQFGDDSFFKSAKVGLRYADRTERDNVSGYNWTALGRGWNGDPQLNFSNARAGDIESRTYENFFRGEANLPGNLLMPSFAMVSKFDVVGDSAAPQAGIVNGVATTGGYGGRRANPIGYTPFDFSYGKTVTSSIYGLVRFGNDTSGFGKPLDGNFGLRVVKTENQSRGYYQQFATVFQRGTQVYSTTAFANERSGGKTFTKVLPSINVRIKPDPTINLRFAFNTTMDLPSFGALKATGSTGVNTLPAPSPTPVGYIPTLREFTTSTGNPELKPIYSDNLDLAAEWYPSSSTSAHISLFHKSLSNVLIYGSALKPIPVTYVATPASGTFPGSTVSGTFTEQAASNDVYNSTEKATVKGFEIGGRTFFDQLPGIFSGLGVEGNYTYIDSRNPGDLAYAIDNVQTTNPTTGATVNSHPLTDNPITGLSKHNFNVTGMYEKGPWSVRLAYSWRSEYLMTTNSNGTNGTYTYRTFGTTNTSTNMKIALPIYADDYGSLDFGASYKLNDHYKVSIEASNLTNEVVKTLMGGYPNDQKYIRSWFVADRRINVNLSISY